MVDHLKQRHCPARGRWVGHDPVGGFGQTFTGWTADQPNLADTPTMLERALARFAAVDVLVDLDAVVERLSLLLAPPPGRGRPTSPATGGEAADDPSRISGGEY